jgi:hypothetical protein
MARILCIHGIGQEFESEPTLLGAWAPALCGGVANAGGQLDQGDVAMAFYGALFRPPGAAKGLGAIPDYRAGDVDEGIERELLDAWSAALEADASDATGAKGPPGSRSAARLIQVLAALPFFGDRGQRFVIWCLKQVGRYLTDPEARASAQRAVRERITDDTRVIVAHSLGSVVAYDVLRTPHDGRTRTLVTLGSPLGTPALMRGLDPPAPLPPAPWPAGVRLWFNIADGADPVAFEKRLARWFGSSVWDSLVHNGASMHDVSRYLTASETGSAILRGLEE